MHIALFGCHQCSPVEFCFVAVPHWGGSLHDSKLAYSIHLILFETVEIYSYYYYSTFTSTSMHILILYFTNNFLIKTLILLIRILLSIFLQMYNDHRRAQGFCMGYTMKKIGPLSLLWA